jgi:hypothetical protein
MCDVFLVDYGSASVTYVFDIFSDDITQVQHKTFAPFRALCNLLYLLLRQGSITMTNSLPISTFPIIDAITKNQLIGS